MFRTHSPPALSQSWNGFDEFKIQNEMLKETKWITRPGSVSPMHFSSGLRLLYGRYGDNLGRSRTNQYKGAGFFFTGILTALTCVAVSRKYKICHHQITLFFYFCSSLHRSWPKLTWMTENLHRNILFCIFMWINLLFREIQTLW